MLEIGYEPLLAKRFPDQTTWISTAFRWSDVRTYQLQKSSTFQRLTRLAKQFLGGLRAAWKQDYEVVVTRCLGAVNSHGCPWSVHLLRVLMGKMLEWLVLFAGRGSRVRMVVLDFTDHITVHPRDRRLMWNCQLYFKRELAHNFWQTLESVVPRGACAGATQTTDFGRLLAEKLRPISLGYAKESLPEITLKSREKTCDLFYSGTGDNIPGRKVLSQALQPLVAKGWRVHVGNGRLGREEFSQLLAQSRLCLSPAGIGWDCYRHYEIIAAGSVPILEYRAIRQHSPFLHEVDSFYYDPQGDLESQLDTFLSTPDEILDRMIQQGRKKLLENYTFSAMADQVMREIERLLTKP